MSAAPSRPRRAALVAFTSQPGLGSEYEVGWRWALLAAKLVRPVVLTRRACWDAIPGRGHAISGIRAKRSHGATFVAIDIAAAPRLFAGRRLMRTHYLIWQLLVLAWLRRHRRSFAFVHHVTFVAAWFPPLAAFAGRPFVWGPIGTNPPMPEFYRARLKALDRLRASVRTFVTQSLVRYNPLLPAVARRCRSAFAISEHVRDLLPRELRPRTAVHPAIGISDDWLATRKDDTGEARPMTMLFVGRALDIKLPRLAYAVMRDVAARLPQASGVMIGEGLPAMLAHEPSSPAVVLREHIAQHDLRDLYAQATVMVFPSVEASGFVTLEALGNGVPVAGIEGFGAAFFAGADAPMIVSSDEGYDALHGRLVEAIVDYLARPERHADVAAQARRRAAAFSWNSYEPFLRSLYSEV